MATPTPRIKSATALVHSLRHTPVFVANCNVGNESDAGPATRRFGEPAL